MKKLLILCIALNLSLLTSCEEDDKANVNEEQTLVDTPDNKEEVSETNGVQLINKEIINIPAPQTGGRGVPIGGEFTKFDFETGIVTTSETDWDIAFRGTTIALNGGEVTGTNDEPARNGNVEVSVVNGTFESVKSTKDLKFEKDGNGAFGIPTGSNNGWYNYNPATNIILAIPGKIFIFKTRKGNYVKVEFLSYYQDQDNTKEGRFYSFNYVLNQKIGSTSLAK